MIEDDRTYFRRRAETEVERARKAAAPGAVKAHYQLAEAYWDKLASFERADSCAT